MSYDVQTKRTGVVFVRFRGGQKAVYPQKVRSGSFFGTFCGMELKRGEKKNSGHAHKTESWYL